MISVAIIEDDLSAVEKLSEMLKQYQTVSENEFVIKHFSNAITFLSNYKPNYDIVFMDIELPEMNGVDASVKLREIDSSVIIIFVTNMAQYAVLGYKVSALDFVVKPLKYKHIEHVIKRAEKLIEIKHKEQRLLVPSENGLSSIRASDILYIEVLNHTLLYHLKDRTFTHCGSLSKLEQRLERFGFARCNSCYLVNLNYVKAVNGFTVTVGNDELQISHRQRKAFMNLLAEYLGRNG